MMQIWSKAIVNIYVIESDMQGVIFKCSMIKEE